MVKPKPKLKDFVPQRLNANDHTERGMRMLAQSIEKNGVIGAMTVAANGETFDGSATWETCVQTFGEDVEPIVIRSDGSRPVIHIREDLETADDPRAIELGIAANRVAEMNLSYNLDVLSEIGKDIDLSSMIYPNDHLNELLESLGKGGVVGFAEPKEEDEEEVAELLDKVDEIESRVKLGEIWQLGRHKLACGDSTIESNVRALLGGHIASLIHADPPYGMGKEKDGVLNDNLYRDKLDDFQMKWWRACRGSVADNASAYIWGNAEDLWRLWYSGGLKNSERLTFRNQIIWDKKHGQGMGSDDFRMFPTVTEHCLFFMLGEQGFNNNADNYWEGNEPIRQYLLQERLKAGIDIPTMKTIAGHSDKSRDHWTSKSQWSFMTQDVYTSLQSYCQQNGIDAFKREYDDLKREWYATRAYFNNTHDNMTDVWEYPRVQGEERWGHATPKPVDMIARIYKSSSPDDGVIYSPFLGSGTDIIAGEKLEGDRTVYGFELSPAYCEVILRRFESLTGEVAKLVGYLPKQ